MNTFRFRDLLENYGADPDALLSFEKAGPDLLPYATLLGAHDSAPDLAVLLGVYEWQRSPLIFFLNGDELGEDSDRLRRVRRMLALRGDAPYLGVVKPGQLTLYRLSLDADPPEKALIQLPGGDQHATLAYLGNQRPDLAGTRRKWISDVVLKLLDDAIQALKVQANVADDDAISLVGRALFTRFLGDRKLIPPALGSQEDVAHLFDHATRGEATSHWLDDTFNGDFLPLSPGLFARLPENAFKTLGDIMRRAPDGQLHLAWSESWAYLDFAHIPVGVLSQAYENHLRKRPDKQRKEGGYYTPRLIADLMVRGAFHALRRDGEAHQAKVLDPAAGAGVFLLTAFRQLVAERWRHDCQRPDTHTLREILYGQITGFDINESALRFAALGLYLLSIELDPLPEPVEKLRFEHNLRDRVLFKMGDGDNDTLGSLGEAVGDEHLGRYDLVIGNPPWSSATKLADWGTVKTTVARIARPRLPENSPPPPLPNEVMDLPFVWRAMEWARPGGQIALALHARLLFLQAQGMFEARAAVFRALDVSGVINGAELAGGPVWPGVAVPFCLLFANNRPSAPGSAFRFVTPHREDKLNNVGGFRVDIRNAEWVTAEQVASRPELMKILFRGSSLDLEIFDRMAARQLETLDGYWGKRFGTAGGHLRFAGNGYQKLRESSRTRKTGDGIPGVPTAYMQGLNEITPSCLQRILVADTCLRPFEQTRIHDPRPRELFRGPLLLIRESPSASYGRILVNVSDKDAIFNQSFHGYSAYEHTDGRLLVRYLSLLIGSRPAYWYTLMGSGRFGVERRVVEKMIYGSIPVIPFESLDESARARIDPLFETLDGNEIEKNWEQVDTWVASLYGLSERDLEVIAETLRFNLPYEDSWRLAQSAPTHDQLNSFQCTLTEELAPWAERAGRSLEMVLVTPPDASPWRLIQVTTTPGVSQLPSDPWPDFFRAADQLAASEILLPDPEANRLWVGRLDQARYWSKGQARLLARRIVWEHIQVLTGQ